LWLLPDWLAKWQSLLAYRRGLHRRGHSDLRGEKPDDRKLWRRR
jgi:hypothetical protein